MNRIRSRGGGGGIKLEAEADRELRGGVGEYLVEARLAQGLAVLLLLPLEVNVNRPEEGAAVAGLFRLVALP